jgi:hypothetical protein
MPPRLAPAVPGPVTALIRMRSQVQVLAGPPPIPAGQSAAGSELGAAAAGLGRAGAARPSRRHVQWPPPGPPTPASGTATTTHRGHPPSPRRQRAAVAATPRRSLLPCPHRSRSHGCSARRASSAASPAPGLLGRRPSRPTARPPTGTSPRSGGDGCPAASTWSPPPPPEVGPDGRVRTGRTSAGWTPDGWTPDGWTPDGWTPDGWTPDGWTPEGWTLDGWTADGRTPWTTTQVTAHRTAGHQTAGQPDPGRQNGMGGHRMLATDRPPTPRLASWPCRPRRRRPTLDIGWRLRRADAAWASDKPGQLSSEDYEGHHAATDGPGHRRDGQLQVLLRRPAGASAHCCRVLDLDGTRRGQWDNGKVGVRSRAGEGVLTGRLRLAW